jgi:hypothetical protein
MSLDKRCRLFALGVVLWICVVATTLTPLPFNELGTLHAGLAAAVAASAFLPRRSLSWSD